MSEERYARRLEGLQEYKDLDCTLRSIQNVDTLYREYREASDRIGTSVVRESVDKARQRLESLAANPRLAPSTRRNKQEIVRWLRVWLEVPDLFFDWLDMRKQSAEFQRWFPHANGHPKTKR